MSLRLGPSYEPFTGQSRCKGPSFFRGWTRRWGVYDFPFFFRVEILVVDVSRSKSSSTSKRDTHKRMITPSNGSRTGGPKNFTVENRFRKKKVSCDSTKDPAYVVFPRKVPEDNLLHKTRVASKLSAPLFCLGLTDSSRRRVPTRLSAGRCRALSGRHPIPPTGTVPDGSTWVVETI